MRDEGGWDGGLSAAGVWRGLVNFGACGQIVVGIGRDPEAPARAPVAMVGALKGGVEILWLLVSGTCLISSGTDLVGDALIEDEERVGGVRHVCYVG
jgi:hypothetical protein